MEKSFEKGIVLDLKSLIDYSEGTAEITVNGNKYTVGKGESIVFPVNAPHAVFAVERFKMLLTMIKG